MRQRRGELIVLSILGAVLLLVSILTAQNQQRETNEWLPLSTHSAGAGGSRALYLWLQTLGHEVEQLQASSFIIPESQEVLWLLAPQTDLTETEANKIVSWVEGGGTLVWIEEFFGGTLADELGLEQGETSGYRSVRAVTPWIPYAFPDYTSYQSVQLPAGAIPLLASEAGEVAAFRQRLGEGEIWFFTTADAFSNEALRDPMNSALVEGILAHLPANARMAFDEFHHGFGGGSPPEWNLLEEMRRSPWGWGIYYAAGVIALWILLRGRTFGRPLPLPGEHLRREAGEYVRGMAWLYRRARLRAPMLRHHHERLKRHATERYRLPATATDEVFVSTLARHRPDLDQPALLAHLRALHQRRPTEPQLLALARANDEWLERLR